MTASKRRLKVQGAREEEGARFHNSNSEDYSMESPTTSPEEAGNGAVESERPEVFSAAGKAPSDRGLEIHLDSPTE
jgi:hypothetical protein